MLTGGDAIVVVEGKRDANVVLRAVNAPVAILGGANIGKTTKVMDKLRELSERVSALVILADPDPPGKRFRSDVARQFAIPPYHAFLPLQCAVATRATKHHEVGNVGVEHARAADVRQALLRARRQPTWHADDVPFTRDDLVRWGLGTLDHSTQSAVPHAALRRELLCNRLGLAKADGTQLLRMLNGYDFQRDEVTRVLEAVELRLPHVVQLLERVRQSSEGAAKPALPVDVLAYTLQRAVFESVLEGSLPPNPPAVLSFAEAFLQEQGVNFDDRGQCAMVLTGLLRPVLAKAVKQLQRGKIL